jgi:D-3-phosphoglycerate dehydrogenase
MARRVLVIDDVYESLILGLEGRHFDVFYEKDITASEVVFRANELQVEGIVVRSKLFFSGEILQAIHALRWIARAGVGTDNIDTTKAQELGIEIINADGANALTVAEHVLGMLLGFLHQLPSADKNVRDGLWDRERHRGRELSSLRVGIIGFGHTGSALARLLRGFEVPIMAYDTNKSGYGNSQVQEATHPDRVWEWADVISVHVPLNNETKELINRSQLKISKRSPIIINASRGAILNTQDAVWALENGLIRGLLLDVWPDEPPLQEGSIHGDAFESLRKQNCVMFSPHVAGWSEESYERISDKLLDNVLKFIEAP